MLLRPRTEKPEQSLGLTGHLSRESTSNLAPEHQVYRYGSDGVLVASVAQRAIGAALTTAKIHGIAFVGVVLDRHKAVFSKSGMSLSEGDLRG